MCIHKNVCVLVCFGTCHFAVIVPPLPLFYSLLNSVPFIFSDARAPASLHLKLLYMLSFVVSIFFLFVRFFLLFAVLLRRVCVYEMCVSHFLHNIFGLFFSLSLSPLFLHCFVERWEKEIKKAAKQTKRKKCHHDK